MSIARQARSAYLALRGSAAHLATLKAESESLALAILTNPDSAFELTSSTVNGQTFSGKRTMTNGERLDMLRLVIKQFENGHPLSTTGRAYF
jgi:hypothetical protein